MIENQLFVIEKSKFDENLILLLLTQKNVDQTKKQQQQKNMFYKKQFSQKRSTKKNKKKYLMKIDFCVETSGGVGEVLTCPRYVLGTGGSILNIEKI